MGAEECKPLLEAIKHDMKIQDASKLEGDLLRFADKPEVQKRIYEQLIEADPSNTDVYIRYVEALMKGGQKELALKHINIFWTQCQQTFEELIRVMAILMEGYCVKEVRPFVVMGRRMIQRQQCSYDLLKVRYYIHTAHALGMFYGESRLMRRRLSKALYVLENGRFNGRLTGRFYQMRLQLATDFMQIGLYHKAVEQMQKILKYKDREYFVSVDDFTFSPSEQNILVNKNKICKIYGELMLITGQYKIAYEYLSQITHEKEYCLAVSDYAVNALLMKCCMELNEHTKALQYYEKCKRDFHEHTRENSQIRLIDFQHGLSLCMVGAINFDQWNEAHNSYDCLQAFVEKGALRCRMAKCYAAFYEQLIGQHQKAILHYLEAQYEQENFRNYPEICLFLSLCLIDCFDNIVWANKYIKKIWKHNQDPKVLDLRRRIQQKLKALKCETCQKKYIKTNALKACMGCGRAVYCGRKCQSKAWKKGHRTQCDGKFRKVYAYKQKLKEKAAHAPALRSCVPAHTSMYPYTLINNP